MYTTVLYCTVLHCMCCTPVTSHERVSCYPLSQTVKAYTLAADHDTDNRGAFGIAYIKYKSSHRGMWKRCTQVDSMRKHAPRSLWRSKSSMQAFQLGTFRGSPLNTKRQLSYPAAALLRQSVGGGRVVQTYSAHQREFRI